MPPKNPVRSAETNRACFFAEIDTTVKQVVEEESVALVDLNALNKLDWTLQSTIKKGDRVLMPESWFVEFWKRRKMLVEPLSRDEIIKQNTYVDVVEAIKYDRSDESKPFEKRWRQGATTRCVETYQATGSEAEGNGAYDPATDDMSGYSAQLIAAAKAREGEWLKYHIVTKVRTPFEAKGLATLELEQACAAAAKHEKEGDDCASKGGDEDGGGRKNELEKWLGDGFNAKLLGIGHHRYSHNSEEMNRISSDDDTSIVRYDDTLKTRTTPGCLPEGMITGANEVLVLKKCDNSFSAGMLAWGPSRSDDDERVLVMSFGDARLRLPHEKSAGQRPDWKGRAWIRLGGNTDWAGLRTAIYSPFIIEDSALSMGVRRKVESVAEEVFTASLVTDQEKATFKRRRSTRSASSDEVDDGGEPSFSRHDMIDNEEPPLVVIALPLLPDDSVDGMYVARCLPEQGGELTEFISKLKTVEDALVVLSHPEVAQLFCTEHGERNNKHAEELRGCCTYYHSLIKYGEGEDYNKYEREDDIGFENGSRLCFVGKHGRKNGTFCRSLGPYPQYPAVIMVQWANDEKSFIYSHELERQGLWHLPLMWFFLSKRPKQRATRATGGLCYMRDLF